MCPKTPGDLSPATLSQGRRTLGPLQNVEGDTPQVLYAPRYSIEKHCRGDSEIMCGVSECHPPHLSMSGRYEPFSIPEKLMFSVSLDVFSMPTTSFQSQDFDCILLCVDRLSGWLVACPTLKLGLTAEKAAHFILDKHCNAFGVPEIIHSDIRSQFIGQWWKTMCARLGVLQTHSPPHRPRANGRAENAGSQLLSILKKLHIEYDLN